MNTDNIDVNELITISASVRAEKDKKLKDKYNDAYIEAIDYMLTDIATKMQESASKGYDKTIIYQFKYNKDPNSEEDEYGNKIKFNGIWLLDMLTKGHTTFFDLINTKMNMNLETQKFYSYYSKKNQDGIYRIFVSWAVREKKPDEEQVKPPPSKTIKRGTKSKK